MTEQTVTWATVAALIEARGGRLSGRDGNERHWRVPSPTGGTLTVEVTLGRRWCSIAVDRWRTTDRTDAGTTADRCPTSARRLPTRPAGQAGPRARSDAPTRNCRRR